MPLKSGGGKYGLTDHPLPTSRLPTEQHGAHRAEAKTFAEETGRKNERKWTISHVARHSSKGPSCF